jgi:hypothetical protein
MAKKVARTIVPGLRPSSWVSFFLADPEGEYMIARNLAIALAPFHGLNGARGEKGTYEDNSA